MHENLLAFTRLFGNSVRDLAPIVLAIGFFQIAIEDAIGLATQMEIISTEIEDQV